MPQHYWCVEWHATLPTTMLRADELAPNAPSGLVVVADYQTHGRGTRGRAWQAPPGTCLMFTLISRTPFGVAELERLPRRVSASIAAALRAELGLACDVKDPNDIVVNGRKLCGVLCSSHLVGNELAWLLCGVGLNTSMDADQRPHAGATSLALEGARVPEHGALLEMLLARLTWLRNA